MCILCRRWLIWSDAFPDYTERLARMADMIAMRSRIGLDPFPDHWALLPLSARMGSPQASKPESLLTPRD